METTANWAKSSQEGGRLSDVANHTTLAQADVGERIPHDEMADKHEVLRKDISEQVDTRVRVDPDTTDPSRLY